MKLPEALRSPPPRDLSRSESFVRHLTRGYRLNAWLGLLGPAGLLGLAALWNLAHGRGGTVFETLLAPLLGVTALVGAPLWI